MEAEVDERDALRLQKAVAEIERQMDICKDILGLQDF
jgi:hypothetical protein